LLSLERIFILVLVKEQPPDGAQIVQCAPALVHLRRELGQLEQRQVQRPRLAIIMVLIGLRKVIRDVFFRLTDAIFQQQDELMRALNRFKGSCELSVGHSAIPFRSVN